MEPERSPVSSNESVNPVPRMSPVVYSDGSKYCGDTNKCNMLIYNHNGPVTKTMGVANT